jgi:hypothetical protein
VVQAAMAEKVAALTVDQAADQEAERNTVVSGNLDDPVTQEATSNRKNPTVENEAVLDQKNSEASCGR